MYEIRLTGATGPDLTLIRALRAVSGYSARNAANALDFIREGYDFVLLADNPADLLVLREAGWAAS